MASKSGSSKMWNSFKSLVFSKRNAYKTKIMLKLRIEKLGSACIEDTRSIGRIAIFFIQGIWRNFVPFVQIAKIMEQVWFIGYKSMFVIVLTAMFTGMVLGLQGYYTLVDSGPKQPLDPPLP